jgi:hypothetical protein
VTTNDREIRGFITHSRDMATRCDRDADDMDRCGLPDVARKLRHQRRQWTQLADELDQHLLAQADQDGDLDTLQLDLEGATA